MIVLRQSNLGTTVPKTEYFPVLFVSSLEIRWYSCVLRLPKQKNLLVLGRRFSASGVLLRRGAPTEEYCRIVSGGQQSRQSMPISRKNRCTQIALSIRF